MTAHEEDEALFDEALFAAIDAAHDAQWDPEDESTWDVSEFAAREGFADLEEAS